MPSLHIEYEICEGVSLLLSIEKLTKVIKLRISLRKYIVKTVLSINLSIFMKEMFPMMLVLSIACILKTLSLI